MRNKGMRPSHPVAISVGIIEGLREETGKNYSTTEIALGPAVSSQTLSSILDQ